MKLTIYAPGSEALADRWQVWVHLADGDPTEQGESFIVGVGDTRDDAVTMAVADLEETIERLQGPPASGTIERL